MPTTSSAFVARMHRAPCTLACACHGQVPGRFVTHPPVWLIEPQEFVPQHSTSQAPASAPHVRFVLRQVEFARQYVVHPCWHKKEPASQELFALQSMLHDAACEQSTVPTHALLASHSIWQVSPAGHVTLAPLTWITQCPSVEHAPPAPTHAAESQTSVASMPGGIGPSPMPEPEPSRVCRLSKPTRPHAATSTAHTTHRIPS
jgi:hypothetical protein